MANSPDRPVPASSGATSDPAPARTTSPPGRRRGAADSKTRAALIEAAAEVMLEEGYAAISVRRVAAKAGVNPGLVHYYFHSMDELFLAVFRQGAEANLRRQARALSSRQPLRALWKINTDPRGAKLQMQFLVLAQYNEGIKAEIAAYAERFREAETKAITRVLDGRADCSMSPGAVSVLFNALARIIILEKALGVSAGHRDVTDLVEEQLRRFD
jgi:AcrR family transcriptional regulator